MEIEDDEPFIIFVNDKSRFVVYVNNFDPFKKLLSEMLIEALSDTFYADNVNPAVIERYIAECGEEEIFCNPFALDFSWFAEAFMDVCGLLKFQNENMAVSLAASSRKLPQLKKSPKSLLGPIKRSIPCLRVTAYLI
jgi:hypothetical protein